MTDALKACPKCGATEDDGLRPFKAGLWGVSCTCGMQWQGAFSEAEAIAAWNTRTSERDMIVAWLRENVLDRRLAKALADAIERGDHLSQGGQDA